MYKLGDGYKKGTLRLKKNTSPLPEDTVETYTLKLELAASENAGFGTPKGLLKTYENRCIRIYTLQECSYFSREVGRLITKNKYGHLFKISKELVVHHHTPPNENIINCITRHSLMLHPPSFQRFRHC